ncbi:MAG: ComF family protein [Streptococcaceae bacterium]|nr:ComF family protein [Streptococcaceae bacterium]
MICLLCHAKFHIHYRFSDLFLLKTSEQFICPDCQQDFIKIPTEHCPRCYKSGDSQICKDCQEWESKGILINHQAIFQYNGAMHDYFSRYKFLGDYQLHKIFKSFFQKFDKNFTVVPIPISPERHQERGFNQVSAFLKEHSFTELLVKSDTSTQSSLDRKDRLNSKNAFSIIKNTILPQKVLLVDDIYTTGATLQHATHLLKDSGVREIKTFSLCR